MYKIFTIHDKDGKQVGNVQNVCQASRYEKEKARLALYGLTVKSLEEGVKK